MKKIHFVTPTKISIIDLSSMGDSSKRGDTSTIGQFDSGLKFSIALALRDNIKINIDVIDNNILESNFKFGTKVIEDSTTGKCKELITVIDNNGREIVTSFAKNLGYNWENYMIFRELYSNMLDENGFLTEDEDVTTECGTIITLEFDESTEFYNVWQNRHLYINEEEPLFKISNSVEVLKNDENYLRIYKQNILVYEDREVPSRFAWNIKFGEIDERRILSNLYSVEQTISYAIQSTSNEDFLRAIVTPTFCLEDNEFLSRNTHWSDQVSESVNKIVTLVYEEFGEVNSYNWIVDKVRKRTDCKISGKKIKTVEDSIWSYSTEVTVETTPQPYNELSVEDTSFANQITKHYNFDLDVEVKVSKLRGSKVVSDKFENCIIIDENFDIEEDFHTFVVEYLSLTQKGNVVENLAKYICKLIKK